jgi:arginine/ornithine transport system permease protein
MFSDYVAMVLNGAWLTLGLAASALACSIAFGLVATIFKVSNSRALHRVADGYTQVVRGIPDLVLMLIVFYGIPDVFTTLGSLVGKNWQVNIPPFVAGSLTLGFIFGAYMAETFRGALLAIPVGQIEAAYAFGMTPTQVWTLVRLPQMIRYALPGFTNNWLTLVKGTAVVSVIGLQDVIFRAKYAAQATHQDFAFYIVSLLVYLALSAVSLLGLRSVSTRYRTGAASGAR